MRKQLAHQAGCAVVTIQKLERDERKPSLQLAQRLGQALQLSPAEHTLFLAAAQGPARPATTNAKEHFAERPDGRFDPTLIGRQAERQTIIQLLSKGATRLLTVTGTGGVGKTRLAEAVAGELAPYFADGVHLVELATIHQPALLPNALAHALACPLTDERTVLTTLCEFLRPRQLLLILDNFEQLSIGAQLLTALLDHCPQLALLVTSRALLHLPGERQLQLEPLALPALPTADPIDLAAISTIPAIRLFVTRARTAQPAFVLDQSNVRAVAELCRLVDGLPLAIELTAARVRLMSPNLLLAHLSTRGGRPRIGLIAESLASLPGSQPTRQGTLRASLAWSYQLLNATEQQAFRHLSLFHGGWRLIDAELLLDTEAEEREQATLFTWDLLTSLLDKSLIYQRMVAGEPRFFMLETVREYAWEQFMATPAVAEIQQRYAQHYWSVAQLFAERIVEGAQLDHWLAAAEHEHANWRAALTWSLANDQAGLALHIAIALWRFWWIRSYWQEGRTWLEEGLAALAQSQSALEPAQQRLQARASRALGALVLAQGEHPTAQRYLLQSIALARAVNDEYTEALALSSLATLHCREGDYQQAETAMLQSIAYDQKSNNARDLAVSYGMLGEIGLYQRDFAKAIAYLQQALTRQAQRNDHHSCMITHLNLGYAHYEQADYATAEPHLEAGLRIARTLANHLAETVGLQQLAELYFATGQTVRGLATLDAAFAVAQTHGLQRNLASLLRVLGEEQLRQGDAELAIRLFGAVQGATASWGVTLDRHEQAALEQTLAQVRAQSHPVTFELLYRAGFNAPSAMMAEARNLLHALEG